ncbi:MAG: DUF1800 family protein [Rudaea sp.]|nr:DUF1800 family protein [Rudaea sp.]
MNALYKVIAVFLPLALASAANATVHDDIFSNGFDIPADAPASPADAARFLTQATFGPTQADINRLMALGYTEWINEELAMPATLEEPTVAAVVNARTAGSQSVSQTQRLNRWFWQATYAPDQLRQRMAFALSQIFVISDASSAINQDIVPMAAYQDLLATDAFASYPTLLHDVTYNPTMGQYLNAFHNVKPNCSGTPPVCTTSPDENYAREVMQLFSIGLIELNPDHSPYLTNPSDPTTTVPTYTQTTITSTAKVFTGFTYSDAPQGSGPPNYTGTNFYGGGLTFATQSTPMACWGTELYPATGTGSGNMKHDIDGDDGTTGTPKTVLSWFSGGVMTPNTIPSNQTCAQDVGDELNFIAGHSNVAPFISRQLIQRFVTSNPSPAYIERVSTVFTNSGGDLGDVILAVLTDTEAENPPALPATSGSCASGSCDSYGKLREPILRLTAMWRAFDAVAPAPDTYGEISMVGGTNFENSYGESPLESPTVFNFYTPDYQQPGTLAGGNLYSPEFQITNAATLYSTINSYYNDTANAYVGMTSPPTNRPLINLSSLTVNVSTPAAMVATINADMLYGTMTSGLNSALTTLLSELSGGGASASEQAWSTIYVTVLSPEYATQR